MAVTVLYVVTGVFVVGYVLGLPLVAWRETRDGGEALRHLGAALGSVLIIGAIATGMGLAGAVYGWGL